MHRSVPAAPQSRSAAPAAGLTLPFVLATASILATGCSSTDGSRTSATAPAAASARPQPAQLFEGLGQHARTVSTKNAQAQRYFDQGLVWT